MYYLNTSQARDTKSNFIVEIILISLLSTIRNLCELKKVDALLWFKTDKYWSNIQNSCWPLQVVGIDVQCLICKLLNTLWKAVLGSYMAYEP